MSTKPQQPLPKQVNVDLSQADDVKCVECEHDVFNTRYKMRKLSALVSPSGQDAIIPMQVFSCDKCGHVNKEFQQGDFE